MAATAASTHFIPVGEYLGTVYRPDVDYVDGLLEERNVGEVDHGLLQRALVIMLAALEETHGLFAIPEIRVQVGPTRFRVPDLCLVDEGQLHEPIIRNPPSLCVEVLSRRDSIGGMRARCQDYLAMGVPEVWIFDTQTVAVYRMASGLFEQVTTANLALRHLDFEINLEKLFAKARKSAK
ncbi:MAG: Uma2 family endonuclease [Acidobacteria bacterium]|nr:Uma2 family endonuclease [Acidobacteriota bacterium]